MPWYSIGTISVTNGSPTVTGTGTAFLSGVTVGWAVVLPDGEVYEITAVDSDTQITVSPSYAGSTLSGITYRAFPTQALTAELSKRAQDVITQLENDVTTVVTDPNLVAVAGLSSVIAQIPADVAAIESYKDEIQLATNAISDTIADTAVDVFVYDTSKDSDGGAWRKRTQHTSWYQETLNTATRGSRREFPAVALIVATSTAVTIYDADDPALPMWMVSNIGSNQAATSGAPSSLAALNGVLCIGKLSGNGQASIRFVADASDVISTSGIFLYKDNILGRNDAAGFNPATGAGIVSTTVNDVAMTVLPDAPIDAATGLPVPRIFVGTDGGLSVIKEDGSVVDQVYATNAVEHLSVSDGRLFSAWENGVTFVVNVEDYTADYSSALASGHVANYPAALYSNVSSPSVPSPMQSTVAHYLAKSALGNPTRGLNIFAEDQTTPANGMVAHITSDYNTGWMHGDIKGAFLSSTDTASLTTVYSSDFSSTVDGWIAQVSTLSVVGGKLRITNTAGFGRAAQGFATTIGKTYYVSGTSTSVSGSNASVYLQKTDSISGGVEVVNFGQSEPAGFKGGSFVATASTTYIRLVAEDITDVHDWESVVLSDADEDRSVNANGLIINGTITRSAVATGADLVGYSGFSASNHLEQPYNADLDFGTGDFCVMVWVKTSSTVGVEFIIDRAQVNANRFALYRNDTSGWEWWTKGATTVHKVAVGSAPPVNTWQFLIGLRDGNDMKLYVDGSLVNTVTAPAENVTDTAASLFVGKSFDGAFTGASHIVALIRISGTAPTDAQIKKIYEDEKFLFQENAQATLFGSSDAVTALAHDPVTNLLHVGTSAGRSDFSGLRRVANTTTAVTTAISAYAGLISEQ